ncbi:hypothetical protein D9613_009505 [Agrocybe pediades]|uniref:PIPK domain-containing protein n=1 Tax=Agrocybe pediades TaxID=84607 RepID=A0A8H4R246_9AGAR|nr:hypothetical protein D9613_009505 [Agrocybe pediades]
MVNHKPLPALPLSCPLAVLSVDSRNHRARLLKHFLADIHEPGIESRRDGWVYVFEEVLDELSNQISREDWLGAIKRGRQLKRSLQADPGTITRSSSVEGGESEKDKEVLNPEPEISPFKRLLNLASRPALPLGEKRAGHLLLCVSPHGSSVPVPTEDAGFDLVPANIGCIFAPGTFSLRTTEHGENHTVLYGLGGLQVNVLESNLRLVGGTFTFKGVNSPMQHMLLSKVLRLGVYIQLSLILEQHMLADSGVEIKFVRPKLSTPSPSTPTSPSPPQEPRSKPRNSLIPSSFANFLKRGISYRSQTVNPFGARGGSLDLTVVPPAAEPPLDASIRKSFDGLGARLNRFSFLGERRNSLRLSRPSSKETSSFAEPFVVALGRVEEWRGLLSTSPGVTLAPPRLLVELAEKDKQAAGNPDRNDQKPKRRLKGDERLSLTSLLGWDGKESEGRGMCGILGFVRQQEISVLCSSHVPSSNSTSQTSPPTPIESPTQEGSSAFTTSTTATKSTTLTSFHLPTPGLTPCGKPHWITYQYYVPDSGDEVLGEWVHNLTRRRTSACIRPGCKFSQGEHEFRVIHDGIRIVIRVSAPTQGLDNSDTEDIEMWTSCAMCDAKSPRKKMETGTYLMSYAKFIELLVYSPLFWVRTPPTCEHTPSADMSNALPPSRFNAIRHFSTSHGEVTVAISITGDIFELRMPRLQVARNVERASPPLSSYGTKDAGADVDRKKVLRKEIRKWWEGVSDHIDKLEKVLNVEETTVQKALPRLPSVDDAYESFGAQETQTVPSTPDVQTPMAYPLPPLPPSTPLSPSKDTPNQDSYFTTKSSANSTTIPSKPPTLPSKNNSEELLATLRLNFQKIEQSLYTQLARTSEGHLNDVRRSFIATGKGTQKRLVAWQKKHLGPSKSKVVGDLVAEEPDWWANGCHALPGGNIIVREDDMGNLIQDIFSTTDYQLELANLSIVRSASSAQPSTPTPVSDSGGSSFFSVATGYRLFTSSSKHQPDPDQEDVVWNEPEHYSAVITRKPNSRDPASFLSIRDVMRQKTIPEQPNVASSGSRFGSLSNVTGLSSKSASAKTKADVALSMLAANGQLDGTPSEDPGTLLLHELENSVPTPGSSRPSSVKSDDVNVNTNTSTGTPTTIRKAPSSSVPEQGTNESTSTIVKDTHVNGNQPDAPPPLPPKDTKLQKEVPSVPITPPATASGFTATIAHGLSSAMRFVLRDEHSSSSLAPPETPPVSTVKHHALLADINTFDDRPHIKYDWTVGKRLKFSCTVYYAKQFDILRKRCGISDSFVQSLSKSMNWAAEGGKSKSNFWKTSDDRYIIKTLVNAWNVADLQVLVELAPSYFRYMDSTATRPTALAKLLGFYTVEIRNLETGAVQTKADLLVMENLFFGQKISKTFDLKGIQGRKVKSHGDTTKTLFDGEWIEGQQRTLTLVRPHSKMVLREAVRSDAEYLSKSNIMDYSLLLGVDEEKKQIICGLVDTIGSYTFAKTLEYKAKQGLQSGKEVTVMPPTEYQDRFVNALEGYFVACPDKWSKPLDESKIIHDPNLLPSVL